MFNWLLVHTGWWWLNALVYVISGGAFLRICYLLPRLYRETIKPTILLVLGHND